jgi:hypothetical protein
MPPHERTFMTEHHPPRRHVIIGTGHRSQMYVDALLGEYSDVGSLVGFVDTNDVRMAYYDRVAAAAGAEPIPHYSPDDLEHMFEDARPDVLIVTSPDFTHARYIVEGLNRGLDVITEKPMTIDAESLRAIVDAAQASTGTLTVTFNYRYSPRNTIVRRLIKQGAIGEVTSVHFEWTLDTMHGADYFRRWHREKNFSGGLLVHKSTHHFDLVNWWIDDVPATVFALGGLRFYGRENAERRGLGERPGLGRDGVKQGDPFALDLGADPRLAGLYLEAEGVDGYLRDRDVFDEGITIEDNLTLAVGYAGGPSLSYNLIAHSPWEGYRVAINGTEGRIDIEVVERSWVPATKSVVDPSLQRDETAADDSARPEGERILLQRLWEPPQEVPIEGGDGGHGGGDAKLLNDLFRTPAEDPLGHRAGYLDGIRSVIIGVSGNESLRTGAPVTTADFGLPLAADRTP